MEQNKFSIDNINYAILWNICFHYNNIEDQINDSIFEVKRKTARTSRLDDQKWEYSSVFSHIYEKTITFIDITEDCLDDFLNDIREIKK